MVDFDKIKQQTEVEIITDCEALEALRGDFVESARGYTKKLFKINQIIKKYPNNKRSYELSDYILKLEQCINSEYKELIGKGALLTHKDGIYNAKKVYETAYNLAKETIFDEDMVAETYEKTIEYISFVKDFSCEWQYEKFKDMVLSDIKSWYLSSGENDLMDGLHDAARDYMEFSRNTVNCDNSSIVNARFSFFAFEDYCDFVKHQIYLNMYNLFKDYYDNYETRGRKLFPDEKEKYYKQEKLICEVDMLQNGYQEYRTLRVLGPEKDKTSRFEQFMPESDFGKTKSQRIKNLYRPYS